MKLAPDSEVIMAEAAATEFVRNFERYRDIAQREAVAVRVHDQITGYFISTHDYEEYQRLKAMTSVALAAHELDDDTHQALSQTRMDARHAALDDLMD